MCSPASFETAYVQRASPTEPIVVTFPSRALIACVPKTSLVENSMNRSSVSFVASAASSTLYVPIRFTRIVRTGLSSTVSTPAMPAQWTMWVAPRASSTIASASSTSPWCSSKFGWSARSVPESASRCRLSTAVTWFPSTSLRASVVPMKPAPPVIRIFLPLSAISGPSLVLGRCCSLRSSQSPPCSAAARRTWHHRPAAGPGTSRRRGRSAAVPPAGRCPARPPPVAG